MRRRPRNKIAAPIPREFAPLPGEPVNLGFTSLYSEPRPERELRDLDARFDAWFKPKPRRRS